MLGGLVDGGVVVCCYDCCGGGQWEEWTWRVGSDGELRSLYVSSLSYCGTVGALDGREPAGDHVQAAVPELVTRKTRMGGVRDRKAGYRRMPA